MAINLHFTRGRWDRFVKHYPRRDAAYGRVHERALRRRLQDDRYNTRRNAGGEVRGPRFCGNKIIRRRFMFRGLRILNPHAQSSSDRPNRIIRACKQKCHVSPWWQFEWMHGRSVSERSCSWDRNASRRRFYCPYVSPKMSWIRKSRIYISRLQGFIGE